MKKILLTSCMFFSVFSFSFAQAIMFSPGDTFSYSGPLVNNLDQIEIDGFVTNNTNANDTICWYVNDINHPTDWEMSVCDKENCYLIYGTGDLYLFGAPAHLQQILHFLATPYCIAGTGNIELTMWLKSDSAASVTHPKFFATKTGICTTGINEANNESVKVFPTNFQSKIVVEGINTAAVKSVKLFHVTGEMMNAPADLKGNVMTLETSTLVSGVYILRVETSSGIVSKKLVKE